MKELVRKNNAFFRQLLFIAVLIVTALVIFDQLAFFVGSVLGALTLYVVFRGVLFTLTERYNWHNWVAALVLVVVCTVIMAGIGYGIGVLITSELSTVDTTGWIDGARNLGDSINEWTGLKVISSDFMSRFGGTVSKIVGSALNTTYSFVANILFMLVILYFMFSSGRIMEETIYRYIPFSGKSLSMLRAEVKNMIFSNAVGIPLVMLGQTIVASAVYWAFGLNSYLFWGFITALCGLIPLVGTGLVYIPMAVIMLVQGDILGAILMLLAGLLLIGMTDNLIRIVFMHRVADTHPLIVVFGVFLGIPLFGFWGIIFGPLMISAFLLLIRIYYIEYGLIKEQKPEYEAPAAPKPASVSRSEKLRRTRQTKMGPPRCKPGQQSTPECPCVKDEDDNPLNDPQKRKL